jgi:hypothetical protein
MTRAFLLAVCTAVGIPQLAHAEDWVEIGRTGLETVFLDMDSGEFAGERVTFRDKIVLRSPREIGVYGIAATDEPGRRVAYTEMQRHYELDCATLELVTLSVSYHDANGTLVSRMAERSPPRHFAPGSLADLAAERMCSVLP